MAANEGTGIDLTIVTEAGRQVVVLVEVVMLVIPLLTMAFLVLSHARHGHDRRLIAERRVQSAIR